MPRTRVKGSLLCDASVTAEKLTDGAVITAKILDGNVTEQKLAVDVQQRLLSSAQVLAKERFPGELPEDTDMTIPGGITWDSVQDFVERFVIVLNGQILGNGAGPPAGCTDWVDVYPGSSNDKIRFTFPLRKGHKIQVIRL
jgi:hypothetical protein